MTSISGHQHDAFDIRAKIACPALTGAGLPRWKLFHDPTQLPLTYPRGTMV